MAIPNGDSEPTFIEAETAQLISAIGARTLHDLVQLVKPDDRSRLRFAAGLLSISESINMPLEAGLTDEPKLQLAAVDVVSAGEPTIDTSVDEIANEAKDESLGEKPELQPGKPAPEAKPVKPTGLKELEKIFAGVLDQQSIENLQQLDPAARIWFKHSLREIYQRNSKKRAFADVQVERVGHFIDGKSLKSAAELMGDSEGTLAQSLRGVNLILGREPEATQEALRRSRQEIGLPEIVATQEVDNEIGVTPEKDPNGKLEHKTYHSVEWQEQILDMLEPFWKKMTLDSMKDVLNNKHPSETKDAQLQLCDLMYRYARFMPKATGTTTEGLTLTQWKTLSRLSGYGFKNGEQKLRIEGAYSMFAPSFKDIDHTNFSIGLVSAIEYLVECAVKDGTYGSAGPGENDEQAAIIRVDEADSDILEVPNEIPVELPAKPDAPVTQPVMPTLAPEVTMHVEPEAIGEEDTEDVLVAPVATVVRPEKVHVVPQIQEDIQKDGYMSPTDIAAVCGKTVKEVNRAINSLERDPMFKKKIQSGPIRNRKSGRARHHRGENVDAIVERLAAGPSS